MAKDLSILIPARNEEFLVNTVEDILKHIEADTEVIVNLDGSWANPPIPQNERVNIIYHHKAIGQRAGTNVACKLSRAKYVMKVDAHCAFDQGFDRKMLEAFAKTGDNVTMLPIMRNLWIYDWECQCGHREYQDRVAVCPKCGGKMEKKMVWNPKPNPRSVSYCFDAEPKFRYFEAWKHREPFISDKKNKGLTETMSIQGSCFMCTRKMYWELKICDEELGSWGNQGVEVACKTWLSGGQVLTNHNTWYAHCFRTKSGVFGFPWPVSGREQLQTKKNVRDLIWSGKLPKQKYPIGWLVKKFWPVSGWADEDLAKLPQAL